MADSFGFVSAILTADVVKLYTCPESAVLSIDTADATEVRTRIQHRPVQTQITSIVAVCYGAGTTFDIWLTQDTTDATSGIPLAFNPVIPQKQIIKAHTLAASETYIMSLGLVLAPGNSIWASAAVTARIALTINRIEIS